MTDIWQYFQQLFQKEATSSKTQPLLHESIVRSEEEIAQYEKWKNSYIKKQILKWIGSQYGLFLTEGIASDKNIIFLENVSVKGFAIYFSNLGYNVLEINYLFDYLKEKILGLNYKSSVSDIRTYTKGMVVESTAKYYLKPSLKNMLGNPPFNQEFGNISIELIYQDEIPKTLKFSATNYNDRSYQKAKPFGQLMEHLLG